jgi:2'-5' RNA ligase
MQNATLRAFLALDFDAEGRAVLANYLRSLRAAPWAAQVRWVSVENLHLTLRFLGDITPAQAAQYADAFRSKLDNVGVLRLRISGPRFFPSTTRPRVIACLTEAHPVLDALAAFAESCAVGIGLPADPRPFQGHITLGRLRDGWAHHALSEMAGAWLHSNAITLYRSQLHPRGPTYSALVRFSLGSQL